jgi:hypothetical protein
MSLTCQCFARSKPVNVFGHGVSEREKVKTRITRKKAKFTSTNDVSSVSSRIIWMTSIGSSRLGSTWV